MKVNKLSPIFFAQQGMKIIKFSEYAKLSKLLILFSFCLFFFLKISELPLRADTNYLEKMGVLRPNETVYAPNFVLPDINGNKIGLSKYHGKFVMLNFWATW